MNTYETLSVINSTTEVIGQAMFDIVSVSFAIMAAGFIMGNRLNRPMVIGVAIAFSAWIIPMLLTAAEMFRVLGVLMRSLTTERLGDLHAIAGRIGADSFFNIEVVIALIVGAHGMLFAGALWFLNYSRKRPGYFAP